MLPEVYKLQETLKKHENSPASYEGGQGYWDDFCLAAFLEGVCNRYIAFEVSWSPTSSALGRFCRSAD